MIKERMVTQINGILQGGYDFAIYIAVKDDNPRLKRLALYEGAPGEESSLQERIRNSIVDTIYHKFLSEGSQYVSEYAPFAWLAMPDVDTDNFRQTAG